MKLQKLTIHNIASIEDATIDFTSEPLASSEVFLITGKTGSGKSTILDAICLALFADTPRLDSTEMQGCIIEGEKEVTISDPRQLMRRNTGEAYATLIFKGNNGIPYEATWAIIRARKKPDGTLQPKNWSLKNLNNNMTLSRDADIKKEIKDAIGLDFNQFRRTTMLAQGEFTRFLNSKDDEKADILEKITGVDIYSKIGVKIFEITGAKKTACITAEKQIQDIHILNEEEKKEKKSEIEKLDKHYNELKVLVDREENKKKWLTDEQQLTDKVNAATESLYKANEIIHSEKFIEQENLVKEWNSSINAREWLKEIIALENNQKKQQLELEYLSKQFSFLLGAEQITEKNIEQINGQIKELNIILTSKKEKVSLYENVQDIAVHLNQIANNREEMARNRKEIEEESNRLNNELGPLEEKANKNLQSAQEIYRKGYEKIKQAETIIEQINLKSKQEKLLAAKDLLHKLETAKERIETVNKVKIQIQEKEKDLSNRWQEITEKKELSAKMDSIIHDAKIKRDVRKEDLEKQSDTINKFATNLRAKLKAGDTCPVCLQKIEGDLPHEEELAQLVSSIKEEFDKAEAEYNERFQQKSAIDAEINAKTETYLKDKENFEMDHSLENATQQAKTACCECGITIFDETALTQLNNLKEQTDKRVADLDIEIKDGEEKENELKKLREENDIKNKEVEALTTNKQKITDDIVKSQEKIKTAEALVKSKQKDIHESESHIATYPISDNWSIDWKTSPKNFAELLLSESKQYNTHKEELRTLTQQNDKTKENHDLVLSLIESIIKTIPDWQHIKADESKSTTDLLSEAQNIDKQVKVILAQIEDSENRFNKYKKQLDEYLYQNNFSIERLAELDKHSQSVITQNEQEVKAKRNDVIAKESALKTEKNNLEQHRKNKPEIAEGDTIEALLAHIDEYGKQLPEISKQKGAIEEQLHQDEENKKRLGNLIQESEDKKMEYQKWEKMNKLYGDATGKKFRTIAQSYVLSSLIHSANSYMKSLTDRYTLKVTPGTFVISIEDAYQGFVSRPASTISGGESFLVSLSLALALSDIGQQFAVDTLFIDEGFGTLSGEPLQNAINTLRTLHSKSGRHVGIISHVEELQEKIPVQIQVDQTGHNSSSTVQIIQK